MTEEETKEGTIKKLTNLSWQRKLNARNSLPKCVNGDNEQYWNYSKPNSELRFNEMKQEVQIHQTQVFKSKNDLTAAPKQNRDSQRENENLDYQKKFFTVKESSSDQRYERQPKNRNDYNGQNYRKDEKENVYVHKNLNRANSGHQIYSLNQKYFKRDDNQNFRRDGSYGNESTNCNQDDNENIVQNQRNFTHQSRNYNQNNRGYHRNQDQSNYQDNRQRNDAKNRNNYLNNRNQSFHQNDNKTEQSTRKNELFKKNNGNSFPQSSNYLKLGTSPENSASGIHYQRTFSSKTMNKNCNSNVTNNQAANSIVGENFIPQTELFAQLDLSSENCGSNVENVYSNDSNSLILSQLTNFANANNFSNDLFSDHFTAGISEPIITNVHQNDTYRNNVQLNSQPNIPDQTVNFVNNYMSSSQSMMNDDFADCSYSNQFTDNTLVRNNQCQFMDQLTSNNIPVTFSSLSPEVADFIPRRNQIQNSNQIEYSSPLIDHHQERNIENSCPLSFSTPNSGQSLNTSWLSQNISGCNESTDLGNDNFQNCIVTPPTFSHRNSTEELSDIFNRRETIVPVNHRNSKDGLSDIFNQQFTVPVNHRNSNEGLDDIFGPQIAIPTNHRNSNEGLNDIFGQQIAAPVNHRNSNEGLNIFNQQVAVPVGQRGPNKLNIFNQQSAVPANRRNSSEIMNDILNRLPTPVSDTSTCQTFNFNGRIMNLCDKQNQIDASQHPPSYDNVQNCYPYQDDSIGNELNYGISMNSNSGTNNYSENLKLSDQQLTNIWQIASINLNQATPVSSSSQQNNDMFLRSNENVNLNQSSIRQTNASILSQNVANSSSNRSVCNVMQNPRVNIMRDYYKKPVADVKNLKRNESEKMDSKFEIVAQQLLNVNNYEYVTNAEMNSGTITTKDSVRDTNPGQFNMATYNQCEDKMEKYRQAGNFAIDNSLLSNNPKTQYKNMFTPSSIESSKPDDTFSSRSFVSSNFNLNKEQRVDVGSRYNDGTTNDNRVVPTEFVTNINSSRPKTNDFQNDFRRNSVPNNSNARYRYANTNVERNTSPNNHQNSFKNDFNRSNNNRRMFNSNQARIESNESTNSSSINIRDDSFINFTRKARPGDNQKFTIAEAPSVGILKKPPPKPLISDTSVQFQKSPQDQKPEDTFISSKEAQTFNNKRVSFLLENDLQ